MTNNEVYEDLQTQTGEVLHFYIQIISVNKKMGDLDRVLEWENQQYENGFREGWQRGVGEATAEGTQMGAESGCIGGMRLGYIKGYLTCLERVKDNIKKERVLKSMAILRELLDSSDVELPTDDMLLIIEAKFTALINQLGVKPLGIETNSFSEFRRSGETTEIPKELSF